MTQPRNPFRNEGDTFRLLVVVAVAALAVIGVTLLTSQTVGALLGLVLVVVAAVYVWRWITDALGSPDGDAER